MSDLKPKFINSVFNQLFRSTGPARFMGTLMVYTALAISVHAQANVTLAWNSASNPLVAGFNIYFGGASGVYTNKISVGTATSLTISNLIPGTTYYFAASTYSAAGAESALSGEVSYIVPAPPPGVQLLVTPTNQFVLMVTGSSGHAFNVLASQNLTTWTVIGTVRTDSNGSATFSDTNAQNFPRRFYRVN